MAHDPQTRADSSAPPGVNGSPDGNRTQADASETSFAPPLRPSAVRQILGESEAVPTKIGRYKVLQQLGTGGMGMVLLAVRDDDNFKRRVAIKVVKRGMDTQDIIRRFELERQVLSALNHPNIAHVMEGGTTDDGRPYFVMEYVEGRAIDEYCDSGQLTIEERLLLFKKVCVAVHHAHQNLVVHRDLKPGNILVTKEGEPKLLDFGIAKLLNPEMMFNPVSTGPELRLMTPEYSSPEQVKGEPITTASDVYSLGVLLYELLTGRRPYRFKSRLHDEIVRIISEVEPEKPSTAITKVDETTTRHGDVVNVTPETVAKTRESLPAKLRRRLAGDIDNIVLMALRKTPRRRYASALDLADDIQRHLDGMPVRARPDTFTYVATKFVKRNRGAVVAASAMLVLAFGGTAGVVYASQQENVARSLQQLAEERANAQQERADRLAAQRELAAKDEELLRARTQRQQEVMREWATTFLTRAENKLRTVEQNTPARGVIAKTAMETVTALAAEFPDDVELQRARARSLDMMGDHTIGLRGTGQGDPAKAAEFYEESLGIRRVLAAAPDAQTSVKLELALSLSKVADTKERVSTDRATESLGEAISIVEGILKQEPDNLTAQDRLGVLLLSKSDLLYRFGRVKEARDLVERSITIRERLANARPTDVNMSRRLGTSINRAAQLARLDGDFQKAIDQYQRVLSMRLAALEKDENARTLRDVAIARSFLGRTLFEQPQPRFEDAVEHLEKALALCARLAEDPEDRRADVDLARAHLDLGDLWLARGDARAAEPHFRRGITAIGATEADNEKRWMLVNLYSGLARALVASGDVPGARAEYDAAIALCNEIVLVDKSPEFTDKLRALREARQALH